MIKTNSKAAREAVRKYIRENYDPEGYDEYEDTNSVKLMARNILTCFWSENVEHDKRCYTFEDLFLEWMAGLPTILHADYFLTSAKDVLGEILEESQEECDRFTETQAEETLTRLIWGELLRLAPIWPFC